MFLYRVKYTESEYDIRNNDLLYKIDQQCQNTSELLESFNFSEFLCYYMYNFHNSLFFVKVVMFVYFINLYFCNFIFVLIPGIFSTKFQGVPKRRKL